MPRFDRRTFLATAVSAAACSGFAAKSSADATGLGDIAAAKGIWFGSWTRGSSLDQDGPYTAMYARECRLIVSGLELHWDAVEPQQNAKEFAEGDAIFNWTLRHGKKFRGHALVWHERLPKWFAGLSGRAAAESALVTHIRVTAGRYAGKTYSWDVVNEAIRLPDGRADGLRNSKLMEQIGPEYLDLAFQAAREADPGALLVLNEYDIELPTEDEPDRFQALLNLVDGFKARNVPIDAIGFQSHLQTKEHSAFDQGELAGRLKALADRGLKVLITEMDMVDRASPSDVAARDADVAAYWRDYLDVMLASPALVAVVTWGLTDKDSWITRGDLPEFKRSDGLPPRPLPFDTEYRPKPVYFAMAEAFKNAPKR